MVTQYHPTLPKVKNFLIGKWQESRRPVNTFSPSHLLACFHCFPNDQKPIKLEKGRKPCKRVSLNQISLTKTPEIPHPADSENTAITQFKIKITEIPHEKLTNTALPQTQCPPPYLIRKKIKCKSE